MKRPEQLLHQQVAAYLRVALPAGYRDQSLRASLALRTERR